MALLRRGDTVGGLKLRRAVEGLTPNGGYKFGTLKFSIFVKAQWLSLRLCPVSQFCRRWYTTNVQRRDIDCLIFRDTTGTRADHFLLSPSYFCIVLAHKAGLFNLYPRG